MGTEQQESNTTNSSYRRWCWILLGLAAISFLVYAMSHLPHDIWFPGGNVQRLVYLLLLLLVVGPVIFLRERLPTTIRNLALWAAALMLLTYGYTTWRTGHFGLDNFRGALLPSQDSASLAGEAQFFANSSGDFIVTGKINNVEVTFLVDTGASVVVLTTSDAERLGMVPEDMILSRLYQTANGTVAGAPIRLSEITLGGIHLSNVRASVIGDQLHMSLLGMSFLGRLSEFSFKGPVLKLYQ